MSMLPDPLPNRSEVWDEVIYRLMRLSRGRFTGSFRLAFYEGRITNQSLRKVIRLAERLEE